MRTWRQLAADILAMPFDRLDEPALYREPYDEPETVEVGLIQATEDIYADPADAGRDYPPGERPKPVVTKGGYFLQ